MSANLLDRAIDWRAPGRGRARARARVQAGLLAEWAGRRGYDGAKTGRRTEGWVAAGGSANAETAPALARLRERARDLERNNPWAVRGVDVLVGNIVGPGILPAARGRSARRANEAFAAWSRHADADGRHDFHGLQALALRTAIVSGESLTVRRRLDAARTRATGGVPLQLQVLEGDHLDLAKTGPTDGGGWVLQGVEFAADGRRLAYWLFDRHPGEATLAQPGGGWGHTARRVPAEDVIHLYRVDRPGQVRGVSWLAPVMLKLRDVAEYDEAELVRKKIEACVVAFVTQEEGENGPGLAAGTTDAAGRRVEAFEPGMIEYLKPGEDVTFNSPAGGAGGTEYQRQAARIVAAGLGVLYEQLTGDLSTVNYSSYRAGALEFRRRVECLRWQMVVPVWCDPAWAWFAEAARLAGRVGEEGIAADWSPPRFESVDPVKDAEADLLEIRMGTKTWEQAVAERGWDPDAQLARIQAWAAQLDAAGLVLDSDPRRQARNGNRAAAPAAAAPASATPATPQE